MSSKTTTKITTKAIAKNPVLIEVIRDALAALEDNDNSSLQAIVRYVLGQHKVTTNADVMIKRSLKSIVKDSKLVQIKASAVPALFKLVSNLREKKKEARKPTKSTKKKTGGATKKAKSTPKKFKLLNYGFNNYTDTTVFLKTEESLWSHQLNTSYTNFQQWGTINFTAGWSNYLHDFSLNRLSIGAYVSVKIARGLTFDMHGGYAFIHDQISLRKGDASIEDILLNRKELSTTYSYGSSIGITYRFGSIYNNVVNPRPAVFFYIQWS